MKRAQPPPMGTQHIKEDILLGEMDKVHSSKDEKLAWSSDPQDQKCLKDLRNNSNISVEDESSREDQPRRDMSKDCRQEQKKEKKGRNPFIPQRKPLNKPVQLEAENQPKSTRGNQSAMSEDIDGLTEWWSTVERWENVPEPAELSEKEETKLFVVTAEKVQKGIRVFNKLFMERAEVLWQHVMDLLAIADSIDRANKRAKIASITGGSTSAVGGVATITGLALAPVTMGTSLIVTAVGLGVTTAGGLTAASAGISTTIKNSLDRKKVEQIVEDYQTKMADINKCLKFINQGIEKLRKYDVMKMKKHGYNQDFPELHSIYEDGAMAGKAIICNTAEILRVIHIINVAGSTAARAVRLACTATGVLTGFFVGMDIYFVAKDSQELKKGAKTEFAAKIREVAEKLHSGLVELNSIRQELQEASGHD